jgi:hypothetical protein
MRTQVLGAGSPPKPRAVVLVVAVTKVTILSTLFSLKEEQDYEREKEAGAAITFVTIFSMGLAATGKAESAGFPHPSSKAASRPIGCMVQQAIGRV